MSLLEIARLSVEFATAEGPVQAVDRLDLSVEAGEILGLVGESGSGKSVTALSILRLIRPPGRITAGSIRFDGMDLLSLSEPEMCALRGGRIAMVPQSPRTALNPVITVGAQLSRLFVIHGGLSRRAARARAIEALDQVGVPDPSGRMGQYAHQLSGGTCQRVMIAMALASSPKLLLADEPTTGLDVSIAARILDLLREIGRRTGAAIILITHDLGIVAETCHRVAVMHAGQLVETGPVRALFKRPTHPSSIALMRSIPRIDRDDALEPIPGAVPSLLNAAPGCRYRSRCTHALEECLATKPTLAAIEAGHCVACHAVETSRAAVA
ncbi:MAG: ABC transporter ATP-binding protein [Variibacter sp.]|nr:ABC transporter ATP-binding protein [Variibacter sp.]